MDSTTPTGRLLRNIVASVAEYEREMIRKRVVAGLRKAKASGKRIGRPKKVINRFQVDRLRAEGKSWLKIAKKMCFRAEITVCGDQASRILVTCAILVCEGALVKLRGGVDQH